MIQKVTVQRQLTGSEIDQYEKKLAKTYQEAIDVLLI